MNGDIARRNFLNEFQGRQMAEVVPAYPSNRDDRAALILGQQKKRRVHGDLSLTEHL
jgi:hypothetical protein